MMICQANSHGMFAGLANAKLVVKPGQSAICTSASFAENGSLMLMSILNLIQGRKLSLNERHNLRLAIPGRINKFYNVVFNCVIFLGKY